MEFFPSINCLASWFQIHNQPPWYWEKHWKSWWQNHDNVGWL